MRLELSESQRAFVDALRSWLDGALRDLGPAPSLDDAEGRRRHDTTWQRMLFEAGYAGINWPAEYGGRGATPAEHLLFLDELSRAGAPHPGVCLVGNLHAGPTLVIEGSQEHKARHLPAILRGDEVWCQGFSEPGAGSDLASLRTRAVRVGTEYVVTGQKVWSTWAQVADQCEMLVRTDPEAPRHRGISWLIVPMSAAGVTVRPLRTAAGTSEFCEVFLDEVRVPASNRVGEENDGWRVAMVTLQFERGTAFVTEIAEGRKLIRRLVEVAKAVTRSSGTAWDDAGLRRDVGRVAAELDGLWSMTMWEVSAAGRGQGSPTGGSALKLRLCELFQELAELSMRVIGRAGLIVGDVDGLRSGQVVEEYLRSLCLTIGGGTSEIQRNIIAERLLGLPKEPAWTSN